MCLALVLRNTMNLALWLWPRIYGGMLGGWHSYTPTALDPDIVRAPGRVDGGMVASGAAEAIGVSSLAAKAMGCLASQRTRRSPAPSPCRNPAAIIHAPFAWLVLCRCVQYLALTSSPRLTAQEQVRPCPTS